MKRILIYSGLLLVLFGGLLWAQGISRVNYLQVGGQGASQITWEHTCTVAFDPAVQNADLAAAQVVTAACAGARIGDHVISNPQAVIAAGLAQGECFVPAVDSISCVFANPTAGNVNAGANTWDILLFQTR